MDEPGTRTVRGRLAGVSVRASVGAGAWVGFALALVVGVILGAASVWFAGAILDWQRDLAFTFGIARRLLPFGDQVGFLRDVQARWWLVIPAVGIVVGVVGGVVGGLLGGILAAAYNRSPRHALIVVQVPLGSPMGAVEGDGSGSAPVVHSPATAQTGRSSASTATERARDGASRAGTEA